MTNSQQLLNSGGKNEKRQQQEMPSSPTLSSPRNSSIELSHLCETQEPFHFWDRPGEISPALVPEMVGTTTFGDLQLSFHITETRPPSYP